VVLEIQEVYLDFPTRSGVLRHRELAQLNGVAHRKLEFVAMLKEEAAQRQRQVPQRGTGIYAHCMLGRKLETCRWMHTCP
jgi:hypothetical protein